MSDAIVAEQMAQAVRCHQQGDLAAAERLYGRVLQARPGHFDALLMSGVLRFQQGDSKGAEARLRDATRANPGSAVAWLNLGVVQEAQRLMPEALASYDRALTLEARYPEALFNRANVLLGLGRMAEALAGYDRALGLNPKLVPALNNRGTALQALGRDAEALTSFERALALAPDYPDAHDNRGNALRRLGRPLEALAAYDRAIALRPNFAEAYTNRGNCLLDLERPEEALASHDKALVLAPDYAAAHNNRANTLLDLGRSEEALSAFDHALALQPDLADALSNRGNALKELGRLEEARASYEGALALSPQHINTLYNLGQLDLLSGRLSEGWRGFEHRWLALGLVKRRLAASCPEWTGEDLRNKRIAVLDEMGLGDTILFARFLKSLVAQGARPVLATRAGLRRLLGTMGDGIGIIDHVPVDEAFEFQIPLMSVPRVLGTTIETIPASCPYLTADADLVARWREALPRDGLRIGIVWQGNPKASIDAGRSIPLAAFAPLARVPGVRLVALQKGHGLDQLAHLPEGMQVATLGEAFDAGADAFIDTAAVVTCLDLVVSIDTAIAHVAGALGRPVWVALRHVPDWRWFMEREDTPWYPRTRLFRQRRPGDWAEVIGRMAEAAAELAREGRRP